MKGLSVFILSDHTQGKTISSLCSGGLPMLHFGGKYRVVDYPLNNAYLSKCDNIAVIDAEDNQRLGEYILSGWHRRGVGYFGVDENIASAFMKAFRSHGGQMVFIVKSDLPVIFNYRELVEKMDQTGVNFVVSGKRTYGVLIPKKLFINTMKKVTFEEDVSNDFLSYLLGYLETNFGDAINHINVQNFFGGHIDTFDRFYKYSMKYIPYFQRVHSLISENFATFMPSNAEIHLGKHSFVKNSIISEDSAINGTVINSLIAPNVKIDRNTQVLNSIILSGSVLGKNVRIEGAIIGEHYGEGDSNAKTIADKTVIGDNKGATDEQAITVLFSNIVIRKAIRIPKGKVLQQVQTT